MIWKTVQFQKKLVERVSQIALRTISTSNALRKTLYEVLGLNSTATQVEIKKAYFELSKLYHPDRIEATDENLARFREISAAYEILGNEQARKLYDRGLLGGAEKPVSGDVPKVTDPIVEFYRKRQVLSKSVLKPSEEIKTWSPPLKKYEKSPVLQKYSYFRKPSETTTEISAVTFYSMLVIYISLLIFTSNFQGSPVNIVWHKLFDRGE